jgi:hypothetical protein
MGTVSHDSDSAGRDYETLVRAALIGAGTSVWEWNPQTDVLSGVDSDLNLLGYGPEEGRLTQQAWNLLIHPDDCAENDEHFLRHARGELPYYEHEYRARTKDGQWRWIAERGRIVEWSTDGKPLRVVGTLVDVTQRHQAESRALAIAAQLSETARHVPGVIYQYRHNGDGDGAFCYVSESCFDVLGLTASEVMRDGAAVLRMIEREHYGSTIAAMKLSARTLTPWRFDFRLRRPDGALRWMTGTSTPQRESDGGVLWYGYFEDSTEVHELQLARQSAAMAQAANRAKTEFLSHMSHELRTPLNAVIGYSYWLSRGALDPRQRTAVDAIRSSGEHLLAVITDILDLAKIEAGKLDLQPTAFDLAACLAELDQMFRLRAEEKDLAFAVALAPEVPTTIVADPKRLRQVLINLLGNAIKFTDAGHVTLGVERLDDGAGQTARLRFTVEDTGIGIAPDQLDVVFRPFEQVGDASRHVGGTGLGLSITRQIVDTMGGTITVDSTPGLGSRFVVETDVELTQTRRTPRQIA